MSYKAVIVGYYGKRNFGDEAILESILANLADRGIIKSDLVVCSFDPKDTQKRHQVSSVNTRNIARVVKALYNSRVLVFAGGGYHFRGIALLYYLVLSCCAKLFGKSVCMAFIGVEPVRGKLTKILMGLLFVMIDQVSVRDFESLKELQRVGIRKRILITSDPVFALNLPTRNMLPIKKTSNRIVVSFVDARGARKYRWLKPIYPKIVDILVEIYHADVVLVATSPGEGDVRLHREIASAVKYPSKVACLEPRQSLSDIADIISTADFAIGMRLHFLILAAMLEIPFGAIVRSPKVLSLASRFEQPILGGLCSDLDSIIENLVYSFPPGDCSPEVNVVALDRERDLFEEGMAELVEFIG